MKKFFAALLFLLPIISLAQSTVYVRADTTTLEKSGGSNELKIKNDTRDTLGLLINIGKGVTQFRRAKKLNDTTLTIGLDTFTVGSGAGGGFSSYIKKNTFDTTSVLRLSENTIYTKALLQDFAGIGTLDRNASGALTTDSTISHVVDARVVGAKSAAELRAIVFPNGTAVDTQFVFRVSKAATRFTVDYQYVPSDASSTDDGGLVIVNGSKRLHAVIQNYIDVRLYDATPNDGTNDAGQIQAALNAANTYNGVKTVLVTNGTYNLTSNITIPEGVTLYIGPGGKIDGSAIITGGIIRGDWRQQLFTTGITVHPTDVDGGGWWSLMWWGAIPNDAGSTTAIRIQKSVNDCVYSNIRKMYWPRGYWNIDVGVYFRKDNNLDGTSEFFGFQLEGERGTYGDQVSETTINLQNDTSFAIGVHRVKGVVIRNLTLFGPNTNIQNLGSTRKWCEDPAFDWGLTTYSNNPRKPLCGFNIDCFGTSVVPSGDRWREFSSFFTDASNAGSTDILIENCVVRYFIVGYACNTFGVPQNGDLIRIRDCWGDFNYVSVSTGESQNRSVFVDNFWVWGGVETVFDSYRYSDGTGNPIEVDGLNIAGGVRYLCRLSGFGNSHGQSVKRLHGELLYSLGGSFHNDNGDLFISDTWIQFTGANQFDGDGTVTHHPKTMFRGRRLFVTGNSNFTYYSSSFGPMGFSATDAVFDNVMFDAYPINNYAIAQTQFRHCKTGIFSFGEGERLDYISPGGQANQAPVFVTDMSYATLLYSRDKFSSFTRKKVNRMLGGGALGMKDAHLIFIGTVAVSNIQDPDPSGPDAGFSHCEFTLSTSSDEFKMLQPGDVLVYQTTDEYGRTNVMCTFGTIRSKNTGTGKVVVRDFPLGTTATTYSFFLRRVQQIMPAFTTGDITSGQDTIRNILIEDNGTQMPIGIAINSPHFPEGTYLVSYDDATKKAVVSNNATATVSNIDVISSDWQGVVYGPAPNPAQVDKIGWKQGDVSWNVRKDLDNNVLFWMCSKSGITNTARQPEFRPIFKQQPPQLADNTTADTYGVTFYYNTTTNKHRIKNNTTWYDIPQDGFANPMTTRGDLITGATSGVPQRLALGSNGYFLRSDGTDAVWNNFFEEGTYTPTFSNQFNLDTIYISSIWYFRVGNKVNVWGQILANPTSTTTLTQFSMTLPVASGFSDEGDLAGTASIPGIDEKVVTINADIANSKAAFSYISTSTSLLNIIFHFSYHITPP